jgi:hypothetical protein
VKTFYPQSALEGFGAALADKLNVRIDYTTGQPRTDGRTVYLPAITAPLDVVEFAALCGVAVHEAAHVFFGSCSRMQWYADRNGPTTERALRAACMNAVLDVADETRVEWFVNSAEDLLRASNRDAAAKIVAADSLTNSDPVWAVLAAAILSARGVYSKALRAQAEAHPRYAEMCKAHWILKKCRARKCRIPRRTRPQWASLIDTADKLVDLLRPFGDASGAPQAQFGPVGAEPDGMGAGKDAPVLGQDQLADEADGAAIAEGVTPGGSGAGGTGKENASAAPFDGGLYGALRPALAGPVERLARADEADGFSSGHLSGPRVGRNIETALIDGRCFDRRNAEGEKLHVAILLDGSGSMDSAMPAVSAIAQAFTDAVKGVAETVSLAVFSDCTRPVGDFRDRSQFPPASCTGTERGLLWAELALKGKPGRRVCVVITDGQPDSRDMTSIACQSLTAERVSVIGIAFQTDPKDIRATMPRAQVIAANTPNELACQLGMIAQRIAS